MTRYVMSSTVLTQHLIMVTDAHEHTLTHTHSLLLLPLVPRRFASPANAAAASQSSQSTRMPGLRARCLHAAVAAV
jgi:hypothetical protein